MGLNCTQQCCFCILSLVMAVLYSLVRGGFNFNPDLWTGSCMNRDVGLGSV